MRMIRRAWEEIRQNVDVYLTIALAITTAILNIFNKTEQQIVSSAILATLAIVSFSILVTRHGNERVRLALENIENHEGLAEKFLKRNYDRTWVLKHLSNSKQAFFWGFGFKSTIPFLSDEIEKELVEFRFLLVKPAGHAAAVATLGKEGGNIGDFNEIIAATLGTLSRLSSKDGQGKIKTRIVDYMPPYVVIAVDPYRPSGRMFVRMSSFRSSREQSPWFELTRANDEKWFEYFVNQFETIWNVSEDYAYERAEKV